MKQFNEESILKVGQVIYICRNDRKLEEDQNLFVEHTAKRIKRASAEWKGLDPCDAYVNHEYICICWEQDVAKPASFAGLWVRAEEIQLRKHLSYVEGVQRGLQISSRAPNPYSS